MPFCTQCGAEEIGGACRYCVNPAGTRTAQFTCDANGVTLLLLYLKTILLSIATLGIYSFWGRTEIRRYLYGSLRMDEDRFAWHGTAMEMLKGWLKAILFVAAFYVLFIVLTLADQKWGSLAGALFLYGGIVLIAPWALVGMQRYRLSRTSLRGIHFRSTARPGEFARLYYKGLGLTLVTLGFYTPFFVNNLHGYMVRKSHYGDQRFEYDGDGRDLFGSFALMMFLLIPTFYLTGIWYYALQHRYRAGHTSWRSARFRSTLRGRDILGLGVTNVLLAVFTLGLGLPWARIRWIQLLCRTTMLENFAGYADVTQMAAPATATGESVSALLELDSDFGGGFDL